MGGELPVHRVGFGTMRLPQTGPALRPDAVPRDRDQALAVLRRAVELGVNHIDTAAFYFSPLRSANELVNATLNPYRDDIVVATKVGPARDASGEWDDAARPEQLRGQVEENLRQLGRDSLDLVYLRVMPSFGESIVDHFGALAELRDAGLIRHLGLSTGRVDLLEQALAIAPVASVQSRFGLGAGSPGTEELLRVCGEKGIAFVPFFAIAGDGGERGAVQDTEAGGASGGLRRTTREIAQAHGASEAQIRLAWSLHQGGHVLGIPGTGSVAHVEQNVAAGSIRLSADELRVLTGFHRGEKNEEKETEKAEEE
ncbi:aldo/keto reductase [Streptacidiphilus monticola]